MRSLSRKALEALEGSYSPMIKKTDLIIDSVKWAIERVWHLVRSFDSKRCALLIRRLFLSLKLYVAIYLQSSHSINEMAVCFLK